MRLLFIAFLLLAGPTWAGDCPRIVSQSPYITRALDWLGLGECIVGVSRFDKDYKPDLPGTGGVIDPDTAAIALPGIPILPLDGPLFTHPGPDLLKGLEQLRQTVRELRP